jgi:hypothetical protein
MVGHVGQAHLGRGAVQPDFRHAGGKPGEVRAQRSGEFHGVIAGLEDFQRRLAGNGFCKSWMARNLEGLG